MTFAPGQVIGDKYEVIRPLGEGGMGLVYQARHRELGALVAIKILRDEVMQDAEAVKRFYREAQAAAVLSGEHVARVLDVARLDSGRPYLVMEFLDGSDLGVILEQRGRLPVAEAVDYVVQACEALDEAHRAGIVHRDLKPANLFVVNAGQRRLVKLVDFGISRFDRPNEVRVTQTQTAFGTPLYMAPESVRSAKLADARTDIWALGVILYELLAGVPPFLGDTPTSVAVAVTVDRQKPIAPQRLDVPPELDAIIAWVLEKDPARRPQSAGELAEALRPFRDMPRMSIPAGVAGVSLPPGNLQVTTARSMTPRSGYSEQTRRTGGALAGDVPKEKRSRVGLIVAAGVIGLFAAVGGGVLFLSRRAPATSTEAGPTADRAPPRTDGAEPAVGLVSAELNASASAPVAAPPSAVAPAASDASRPAASVSSDVPAPPKPGPSAKTPPAPTVVPTSPPSAKDGPKPAPDKPGGNPLHL